MYRPFNQQGETFFLAYSGSCMRPAANKKSLPNCQKKHCLQVRGALRACLKYSDAGTPKKLLRDCSLEDCVRAKPLINHEICNYKGISELHLPLKAMCANTTEGITKGGLRTICAPWMVYIASGKLTLIRPHMHRSLWAVSRIPDSDLELGFGAMKKLQKTKRKRKLLSAWADLQETWPSVSPSISCIYPGHVSFKLTAICKGYSCAPSV